MKRILLSLLKQYLFLMVFFLLLRAVFLIFHMRLLSQEGIRAGEALYSFWQALKLDTATAAYILVIPAFFLFLQGLFRAKWLNIVMKIYYFVVVFAWSLVTAIELGIYPEWKTKLTTDAFIHLQHIDEAYYSIPAWLFFLLLGIFIILTAGSFLLYLKVFFVRITARARWLISPVIYILITLPSLFAVLRGGFDAIPISQSAAHYSQHMILNWATVNSGYHLAVNMLETNRYKKHGLYGFYDIEEARETVRQILHVEKDTTVSFLNTDRPNIIILLMESWTADLIESLGAEPGITPEFTKLEKDGILFTRFYCSGNRSHEAFATMLGGHPALPYTTFTENPQKFKKMPSMTRILNDEGYHSSFFYGGQLDYGNMRAYALFNQFHYMIEEKTIPSHYPRGRLGVHDEFLYEVFHDRIGEISEPFLSMIFTLSSHSPYDHPMEPVIDWAGTENPFINSAYYSDKALGEFFREARKQPWYPNTLFVIMADHGHNSYRHWRYESYEYHHIPLFFYGEVLKEAWRGTQVNRIADNTSFTKTLLNQLNLPSDEFPWGSDLFNPYSPEFAYVVLNNGYMWKTPEGEVVYSMKWQHFYKKDFPEGTAEQQIEDFIRQGKSYVQVLFQDFLDM